jgi:hypothetical protein
VLPVTVTIEVPEPVTVKDAAVILPADIEHEAALTAGPVIDAPVHVSVGLNPLPETVTIVPVGAALGLRVIVGPTPVTVNTA